MIIYICWHIFIFIFEFSFSRSVPVPGCHWNSYPKVLSKQSKSFCSFSFQDLSQMLQAPSSLAMGKLFPTIAILNFVLLLFKFTLFAVGRNIIYEKSFIVEENKNCVQKCPKNTHTQKEHGLYCLVIFGTEHRVP